MIKLALVLVFARACRCPPGLYLSEGVRPTGETVCSTIPPHGCGEPGSMLECPDGFRFPLRIECAPGTSPRVDRDGLGARCVGVGIPVPIPKT